MPCKKEKKKMNNKWNRIIYKCWAPFYDLFFNRGVFYSARKQIFHEFPFGDGENVLFVGVGTGADLAFCPLEKINVIAIDYSKEMLEKAKNKYQNENIKFIQMDAQSLTFPNNSFDVVVASLVISVVPSPEKVMSEIVRVTKKGGRIIIFDKFAPKHRELSFGKKVIRPIIKLLGTDIGISFEKVYKNVKHECYLVEDKDVMIKGMYRKIILKKLGD
jgi:phosphatidylethanolamine/phosphatidyl-N-methylethanolamine N-methyltransferase